MMYPLTQCEEERAEAASQRICREEAEAEAIADGVLMGFTANGDGLVSFADLDPAELDTALHFLARIVIHGKRELPEAHRFINRLRDELTALALRRMRT